jgi:undecaprenyl-phosphate galactose phosphotransferase
MLMAGDVVALVLSFLSAYALTLFWDGSIQGRERLLFSGDWMLIADSVRLLQFVAATAVAIFIFWTAGHYFRRRPFWDELHDTTKLILIFACVEATVVFISGRQFPRIGLLGTWGFAIALIPISRFVIKHTLTELGWWSRPTVIIGTGRNALDTAAALQAEKTLGYNVALFLSPPPSWSGGAGVALEPAIPDVIEVNGCNIPVKRMGEQCEEALRALGAPHVVVALESDDMWEVSKLLLGKSLPYSSLTIAPTMRGLPMAGMEMLHFFKHDVLMLRVQNNLARQVPQRIKRTFDLVAASMLLVALAPLFAYVMISIRRSGPGVFFGHTRIGKDGKSFKCYKFRTMVPNAQELLQELLERDPEARAEWARDFKLKNDPRVTTVGAFLRKTSLDELPQLWNVINGDMSLVGPRPVIEEELERYENKKDFFLQAKPGMTGLWQVSGRNDVTYEERVRLDAWYARNWQMWYDIVILLKTVKVVFGRAGAY